MDPVERHKVVMSWVEIGYVWQDKLAEYFRSQGLPAISVKKEKLREIPSTDPFPLENGDVMVGDIAVESKTTFVAFTYPSDFKYERPMIDGVNNWRTKKVKPRAVVVTSRENGSMMWISVKESFAHWKTVSKANWDTKIVKEYYAADKKWWYPIEDLVVTLKAELGIN